VAKIMQSELGISWNCNSLSYKIL